MSTQNTTHTVQYRQPSPLAAMPHNKWAQFLLGAFVIFIAFKLAFSGWFSRELFGIVPAPESPPADGVGNVGLLPFLIDGVCFVGILGFTLIGFMRDLVGPMWEGMSDWVASASADNAATETAGNAATIVAGSSDGAKKPADAAKTAAKFKLVQDAINQMHHRIVALESLHPELLPDPEPEPVTVESLAAELAAMKSELAVAKAAAANTGETKPAVTESEDEDA